jgi:hypothetical protein
MQKKAWQANQPPLKELNTPPWCIHAANKHASNACKLAALHHRSLPQKISLVQGIISPRCRILQAPT